MKKLHDTRFVKMHAGHGGNMAPCVLVVDDDRPIQGIVADLLSEAGFDVVLACNGAEALRHLQIRVPDVLVTDLKMPVLDGWTLVKMCRTELALNHLPIVVVTAEMKGDLQSLRELCVDKVIDKPFDIQVLVNTVSSLVDASKRAEPAVPLRVSV
jgi:CheY-like chemotaxis protein